MGDGMNMRAVSPLEAQRQARHALNIDKVRMATCLRSIAQEEGFDAAMQAAQQALRSLAAEMREDGSWSLNGWVV